MLLAAALGLLLLASVAAFVVPLRLSRAGESLTAGGRGDGALGGLAGVGDLVVGGDVVHDGQTWVVRGVQHVTAADGAAWSAWHLDDRGQGGIMLTAGPDEPVVFGVRAERPESIDATADVVVWRDHEWRRTGTSAGRASTAGERRQPRRGALVPLADADVERVDLARPDLGTRRLVLERVVGEATWNAWIGTALPGTMFDVWAPGTRTGAGDPTATSPRPDGSGDGGRSGDAGQAPDGADGPASAAPPQPS